MAWRRIGGQQKALSEPMVIRVTDTYMRHRGGGGVKCLIPHVVKKVALMGLYIFQLLQKYMLKFLLLYETLPDRAPS